MALDLLWLTDAFSTEFSENCVVTTYWKITTIKIPTIIHAQKGTGLWVLGGKKLT